MLVVRHGETEWNRQRRRQGQLDSPLTREGTLQAEQLATALQPEAIDHIFSSPLGRAHHTARLIATQVHVPVILVEELAEVHHGTFAGFTNDEIEARHPGELQDREHRKYTWRFPEGESYADADTRAALALQRIADEDTDTPLLVTHEMIARMLLRVLLDASPDEALKWSLPLGSITEVQPAGRTITVRSASISD